MAKTVTLVGKMGPMFDGTEATVVGIGGTYTLPAVGCDSETTDTVLGILATALATETGH